MPCKDYNDGTMFLDFKLENNKISKTDYIAVNGRYTLFINQFIEKCEKKGININDNNFIYPIQKQIYQVMTQNEIEFNKIFGSFYSIIENQFGELSNTFHYFNNNKSAPHISDCKIYNLQLKLVCLLKNIKKFVEIHQIEISSHHKLWENNSFEYFQESPDNISLIIDEVKQTSKINEMLDVQKNFLNLYINNPQPLVAIITNINTNMIIDDKINKKKDEKIYEVERIINHHYENTTKNKKSLQYLVKWKEYLKSLSI